MAAVSLVSRKTLYDSLRLQVDKEREFRSGPTLSDEVPPSAQTDVSTIALPFSPSGKNAGTLTFSSPVAGVPADRFAAALWAINKLDCRPVHEEVHQ
jgi:hypothetical protein